MFIVIWLSLGIQNLVESLRSSSSFEERVWIKIAHDFGDGIVGNMFKKLVLKSFYLFLFLHLFFLSLVNILLLSISLVVFPFEFSHKLLRFLWLFDKSINDIHRLLHLLNHRHDLNGSSDFILAELMNDSDVILSHFFEPFAQLSDLGVDRIYLLFFHFVILWLDQKPTQNLYFILLCQLINISISGNKDSMTVASSQQKFLPHKDFMAKIRKKASLEYLVNSQMNLQYISGK